MVIKNRTKRLSIYRGLPGSGKSTKARESGAIIVEPQDQWACQEGDYALDLTYGEWDMTMAKSYRLVDFLMREGYDIAVAEVLPKLEDVDPYLLLAHIHGYNVDVVDLHCESLDINESRSTHDVPLWRLQVFQEAWEDWDGTHYKYSKISFEKAGELYDALLEGLINVRDPILCKSRG